MKNRKELKQKLEQKRKYLANRINELKKSQVELSLKSILICVKQEELEQKKNNIDDLINEIDIESKGFTKTMNLQFKFMQDPTVLFLN